MKTKQTFCVLLLSLAIFIAGWTYLIKTEIIETEEITDLQKTTLVVKNANPVDTINVYLTLGQPASDAWVKDVKGLFGITTSGGSGIFRLAPNDSLSYVTPTGKGIQGNVCFVNVPVNCPTTLCEFCLNNYSKKDSMAQETVEISCVQGVSYLAKYTLNGGGQWIATTGVEGITTFKNGEDGTNSGLVGVYPVGCDDCTASVSPPACVKPEKPQTKPICNISRNASLSGGTVTISYLTSGFPAKK